jgi:hypothetical protein
MDTEAQEQSFYTRGLRRGEAGDLEAARQQGLLEEIAMLRITIRRAMTLARDLDDLDEVLEVLKVISAAAGRLASLMRAHAQVSGKRGSELEALFEQALAEVSAELGIK